MKRVFLLTLFISSCVSITFAQTASEINKWDFHGGYSLERFESNLNQASFTSGGGTQTFSDLCSAATGQNIGPNAQKFFCSRRNFQGFDASITRNLSKYVGVTGDFSAHFNSQSYVDKFTPPGVTQTISNRERLYQVLGGLSLKNNKREARFKPFAHVLAGVARYTNRQSQDLDLFPQFNFTIDDHVTSFAMKVGGGLDIRAGKRIDIRLIQIDYNPILSGDRNPKSIAGQFTSISFSGRTAHNITIGAGIVFH